MHNNICRLYKFSLYLTEFHVKNARCIIRRRSFQIYAHESGFHIRIQTHWRCVVALLFIYKGGKRRSRLTKKKKKPITYKRNIDETTSFKRMLQHLLEYIPRQRFTALCIPYHPLKYSQVIIVFAGFWIHMKRNKRNIKNYNWKYLGRPSPYRYNSSYMYIDTYRLIIYRYIISLQYIIAIKFNKPI